MLKTRYREKKLFETCIETKQPFVIDNTNPSRTDRERYINKAKAAGFSVTGYYFRSDISSSIERNNNRLGSDRIPEKGIKGAYNRLELPDYSEGFDKLYYVLINEKNEFVISDWKNEE